jgi:hypothetical protein
MLDNSPEPLLLIGHSAEDRFPGFSYNAYTLAAKKFYCLDMGGLPVSRGPTTGGRVACKRVWFSFGTGHPKAAARAPELGMAVVEIGRCPVLYLHDKPATCKALTFLVKATGLSDGLHRRIQTPNAASTIESVDSALVFHATSLFTATKQSGNNRGLHQSTSAVLVGLLEVRRSHEKGGSHY